VNNIQKGLQTFGGMITKNSPYILTGLGCGGVFGTALLTGHSTLKAYTLISEEELYRKEELSFLEKIKLTWKCFVPPILLGATTISCIVGAQTINAGRTAALAALYSLSETAFREYKDKVIEEIGKGKELKIRDSVAKDRIANSPVGDRTIIITGHGDVLCHDKLSDRYFRSSVEKIRQQVVELDYDLMKERWLVLNDLYYAIGLDPCVLGEQSGFDVDKGLIQIEYSSQLTPEGQPCLAISAQVYPNPNYMR